MHEAVIRLAVMKGVPEKEEDVNPDECTVDDMAPQGAACEEDVLEVDMPPGNFDTVFRWLN